MPAVPFIAVALGASGALAAGGAAIASAIGLGTVSAAAATAIGAGAFSAAATAIQGGDASDVLKSAVLGGVTSFAGSAIAGSIGEAVRADAILNGTDVGIANAMGKVIGGAAAGAVSSGTSALLSGKDPIEALLKGGLTAAMSTGIGVSVDALLKDVPALAAPANNTEAAIQRAMKAAIGTAIVSGGNPDAIGMSVLNSFASTAGQLIGAQLKDSSSQLRTANQRFTEDEIAYRENLSQQEKLVNDYNAKVQDLKPQYDNIQNLISEYDRLAGGYNNYDSYMRSQGYTQLGGERDYEGNEAPTYYAKRVYQPERQMSGYDADGYFVTWTQPAGYDWQKASSYEDRQSLYDRAKAIDAQATAAVKEYTEKSKALEPIKQQLDALKAQVDPLGKKLVDSKTNLETAVADFNQTEASNAALVKTQLDNFTAARDQYKEEFGVEPTEDQLKDFAKTGDILGTVSKLVADNNNEQVANAAGFESYADYTAAGNISPNDYYAKQQGWQDYAQKLNAVASGYNDPNQWNTYINNQQAATSAGFLSYEDYQSAGETPANDFYAKKDGWGSYAEKQQAEDSGFRNPAAWNTHVVEVKNQDAAKAAGFPDYETQVRFGNDINEYKAVQEGWQSLGAKQAAAGYEITSPEKYQEFMSGKTEEDKVVQMLQERGIPATPERVADIMKSWDFNPTTPNVGFSDAFNQSDKLNISNSRADSVQEAAALAKSLGYSTFSFGGDEYKLNTAAPTQNPYDSFATFGEAFKAARQDLGDGQVFQWTNPQTGKTGYFTTNLAGEKVTDGGFDATVTQSAKSRLLENLGDWRANPADLNAKDMAKFVDQFANASPAQRASLLNGSNSLTFKVINDALTTQKAVIDNTEEAIKSGRLDLSKPIEGTGSIKASDVTNYKQILSSIGTSIATDITSTALSGANIVGSALGLDTNGIEKTQKLLSTDKNKQMDKLVGLEKNAAAGFASAIESAFSFALGGAPAAIGVLTSFAANNAWLEGKEAGLSNQDNAIRTATMAAIEAAGEAIGIPGLSRLMKGVPMTGNPAEIVNSVKNISLAMGNQQISELASTAASFAVDKVASFGLGKNATYQDFADALKDTVLTTAFAVGGTGTIGQASRALQSASTEPTTQLWSQNLPDEIWNRIKDAGVSQSEVDSLKSNLRESFGSENYNVQKIQENFENKLKEAGFTDQEISRIAEPAAVDVIADQAKASLEKAGVPKDYVDMLGDLSAKEIYSNRDLPSAFNNLATVFQAYGFDPIQANLITNQTLTGTDVKQVVTDQLKAQGYTPTQAEIDNLVSQNAAALPAAITSSVSDYTGPRTVTKDEAKASLVAAGIANPTEAQVNALVGQYDQNLLQSKANSTAGDISTQLSSAEKASFDRDAALSKTLNDISAQVTANQNAGMNSDQALQNAITQVATNLGTTKEDLLKQVGQTEQGLKDQIAGLQQKTSQDIAGVQTQLGVVESTLAQKIADNEASGMARDQAIEKAVSEVAQSVGQSKTDLLALIGQTQENLTQQYASGQLQLEGKLSTLDAASQQRYQALSEDQKLQAAQMAQQGKDLTQAINDVSVASQQQITGVESKLSAAIEAAKQSGLQGDAALQSAINTVAGDLGTTKEALLAQIGTTEAGLRQEFATQIGGVQTQIGDVKSSLEQAIKDAQASGLQGDQALQSAIDSVASNLGTTKEALLTQIGSSESQLRSEMQAGQALTSSQIAGLESQLTEQGRSLVAELQQQGVSYQQALSDAIAAQNAQITAGQEQTAQQIAGVKDSLTAQITANEAAGLSRDEATTKAINDLSTQMGVDKDSLLTQLGTTEQALRNELQSGLEGVTKTFQDQYNALSATQKAQFDAMVEQGASTQAALAQVQAGLQEQITSGQQQTAEQIAALNQSLSDRIAANEASGLTRDQAINKAVQDVAASVGTTKESLLAQIGQTEAGLQQQFAAGQAQTQAQIAQLDAATQEKFAQMTEAQKAQALQLAQTTQDLQGSINTVAQQTAQQIAAGQQQTAEQIQATKDSLSAQIAANEAAGLTRDEATTKAIGDLSTQMGVDRQTLLNQLGTTEQGLRQELTAGLSGLSEAMQAQYSALNAAQKAQFDAMVQQGTDINAAMAQVQAGLQQQIGELSQTQSQQYNQLSQGQKDLYSQLVAQGATQSDALNTAVANLSQEFQNKLAASDAATQAAFGQMTAAQQAEAQARVQQGQDLQAAITASQQATQQQITGGLEALSQDFQGKLAASDAATQAAFAQMTTAQQAETQARVQQGQDLQSAISASSELAAQQLAQTQAALEGQLSAQGKQFFDALRQQGLDYGTALQQAVAAQNEQIAAGQRDLSGQIGALGQATQQQYANLTAAQQKEVADRVAQGESLQNAIAASQQATQEQISAAQRQAQEQYNSLSAAQKAETDARVAQGQSLQSAISDVQSGLTQQITQQGQQTQQQISALSQQTQDQYRALTTAQQAEVNARVAQGQSFDAAIAGVGGQLSSLQLELEAQKSADEAYRKDQAEKAAAASAKAAEDARRSSQTGILSGLAGIGAAAGAEEARKSLQPRFLTSKGGDTKFKGLLEEFQQEVEGAPNMPDNTGNRQQGSDMSPYYSYGNETSLDQILGQDDSPDFSQNFASGGLATPLMAGGGTTGTRYGRYAAGGMPSPLMAAGGKMRVDFRRGDAVTGPGDGQSDDIPAMLADGEFVFPADVVAAIGNGSTKAGSDKLYDMMHSIRAHVRSAKPKDLPPEIKSPLDFLKASKTSKKRSA